MFRIARLLILQMCLEYGYNEPACRMASKRWNALDNTLKSIDVLHFFYYSALVYLKARNYLHARSALVKVLSVPGSAISVVQATALRKLCIVDLIMFGEVRPLPSWLPKSNPLLDRLLDGVRGANRLHDSENDFSPEKSVTRSSRSTTVPSDAFEIANPEVSCPSHLRDVVRVFTDPNASISGLVTCLGKFEQQLRISKDWGLACRLVVAKQSHLLLKISNVFERVPLKYIKENCECSSEKELHDVLDFFNHMSCITGIVVRRKDEELFEFNISTDGTNDQFDSLRREIGYLKSIQTL